MALHVHVGLAEPEDAIGLVNGLRRSVPVLLALSANSPFSQGRDGGFDSMRTVIFQAFPRTGLPRSFAGYADYVDALDAVIGSGAYLIRTSSGGTCDRNPSSEPSRCGSWTPSRRSRT